MLPWMFNPSGQHNPMRLLLLLPLLLATCEGWNMPRLSLGVTGESGTQYGISYDGKTVALDMRLPKEEGLRK